MAAAQQEQSVENMNEVYADNGPSTSPAPALMQRHLDILKFIGNEERLFYFERISIWLNFHTTCQGNMEKYADLTPYELQQEFIDKILPRLDTYQMNTQMRNIFKCLQFFQDYRRVECGWLRKARNERLTAAMEPKRGIDYCLEQDIIKESPLVKRRRLSSAAATDAAATQPHTVITQHTVHKQGHGKAFCMDGLLHSLISAMVSDDYELSGSVLLAQPELRQRLRKAKINFEQKGQMPKHCLNSQMLREDINKLQQLRQLLVKDVSEIYLNN